MKPSEIVVGGTYRNRGAGSVQRVVTGINGDQVSYYQWPDMDRVQSIAGFCQFAALRVDDSPAADLDGAKGAPQ